MSAKIFIRKATQPDCAAMLDLIKELAVYEKAPNEVTVTIEEFADAGFGKNPVWWAFVAEDENTKIIVGFALFYIRYSTWKGKRIYLEDFLVTEQCRGLGVGKLLFDELIEEAKRLHINAIVWQVLDWNKPAINFYNKYNAVYSNEWLNGCLNV